MPEVAQRGWPSASLPARALASGSSERSRLSLQANLPVLQRELLHCARLAKQTPAQYLAQHEQLLLDASASSPIDSSELLLEVNENGKRATPDRCAQGEGAGGCLCSAACGPSAWPPPSSRADGKWRHGRVPWADTPAPHLQGHRTGLRAQLAPGRAGEGQEAVRVPSLPRHRLELLDPRPQEPTRQRGQRGRGAGRAPLPAHARLPLTPRPGPLSRACGAHGPRPPHPACSSGQDQREWVRP